MLCLNLHYWFVCILIRACFTTKACSLATTSRKSCRTSSVFGIKVEAATHTKNIQRQQQCVHRTADKRLSWQLNAVQLHR